MLSTGASRHAGGRQRGAREDSAALRVRAEGRSGRFQRRQLDTMTSAD